MHYTKLLSLLSIFVLLLGGCTSGPTQKPASDLLTEKSQENSGKPPTEELTTRYQSALTELSNGDYETAKKSLQKIIDIDADLAGPWANLALIHIKQQNYQEAEKKVKIALEKNPEMAQALNITGFIEYQKGNINTAKHYYQKAITNKPDYALAHYNLALLYDLYLQDIAKAVIHYQHYLNLSDHQDKKTRVWVKELKRNLPQGDT
ncbi:hypothetical protein MNBD_GAMMA18-278 [hydrothermal vent metagenome]|uniref:Uncharacterized protein n=1 Tax=hydrothermal vent metagenome TaxID=652676 RepID=A0A3B0ZMG0_9ZZZZ